MPSVAAAQSIRPLAGLLLTGGRSSRMGRDKALLPLGPDGRPLAEHLASLLCSVASPVLEVGPGLAGGALPHVDDPANGPLVALVCGWEALQAMPDHRADQAVLLLATDLPLLTAAELRRVASAEVSEWAAESVVPMVEGRRQPLCARWSPQALARAAELVAAGERRLTAAFDATPVIELDLGEAAARLADVDDPADLRRLGIDVDGLVQASREAGGGGGGGGGSKRPVSHRP